ncbi:MAG: hypothetical protein Ct9H300mP8_05330 [Gammaproteobacteria bacterium]|nr:MAG: hypothetical protein Ct9H300mP8_05330 [Gammaproteobacteria bacterium]
MHLVCYSSRSMRLFAGLATRSQPIRGFHRGHPFRILAWMPSTWKYPILIVSERTMSRGNIAGFHWSAWSFGAVRSLADEISRHAPNPVAILFCRDCFDHVSFVSKAEANPKNPVLSCGSSWELFGKFRTY